MDQPPGFESSDKTMVCKLNKALYGLTQAPRAWFENLKGSLLHLGLTASRCAPSLFTLKSGSVQVYMLVYVDDIIITGSDQFIKQLINKLNSAFSLKDLGHLDYFLGIEVKHQSDWSLLLSQGKYIRDLLLKHNLHEAQPFPTPMVASHKQTKIGSPEFSDPFLGVPCSMPL